jgi:hypothetical protein
VEERGKRKGALLNFYMKEKNGLIRFLIIYIARSFKHIRDIRQTSAAQQENVNN